MRYIIISLLLSIQLAYAQTPVAPSAGAVSAVAPSADAKAVLDTEKQRFAAQVSKNYEVLDKVLANDMVYVHSSGSTDTKQSYVQSMRDGKLTYESIDMQETNVRVYGNTAVVNGTCTIKAVSSGQPVNNHIRYTSVYVRNKTQWQMVAWQSLKI
jgi:hypothetical protein